MRNAWRALCRVNDACWGLLAIPTLWMACALFGHHHKATWTPCERCGARRD